MNVTIKPGVRYLVVPDVTWTPIVNGAVCVLDLDNTLIKTTTVFDKTGPINASGKSQWRRQVSRLQHPDIAEWLTVAQRYMTIIYETARLPEDDLETRRELMELGLPLYDIIYAFDKGPPLAEWLVDCTEDTPVLFVDDLDRNHRSVLNAVPHARCYRVADQLYNKLKTRVKRT